MPCQILDLCSGGVPPTNAPSQDPMNIAANLTANKTAPAQSVATRGFCDHNRQLHISKGTSIIAFKETSGFEGCAIAIDR